jgi:hypothetical protein
VAVNSVLYAQAPERALAELSRVPVSGGRVVITLGCGAEAAACAALVDPLLAPGAQASSRTSFGLEREHRASRILADVGLRMVSHEELRYDLSYDDLDTASAAQMPAGPVQAAADRAGGAAVSRALAAFFAPFVGGDGVVSVPTAYPIVVASVSTAELHTGATT